MVSKTRLYYTALIAAVFAVTALICSTVTVRAAAPTEIIFWHAMGRSRGKVLNELVDKFNQKNPDVVVKAQYIQSANQQYGNDYNALYAKILESIAKNSPPDVAQVYENWTTQYVGIDALVPVEDVMPEEDKSSNQDLVPIFLESNKFTSPTGESKLYTLPFNKSIYVLYYNKKLFNQLKIAPPNNWQELRAAAKAIYTKTGLPGLAFQPSVDIFGHYLYSYGGSFIKDNKAAFGNRLGVEDLYYWNNLVHTDMSAKPTFDAAKEFSSGKAGMYIETTSKIGGFTKSKAEGLDFGVMPIPKGTVRSCQFAGTNLAIFKSNSPEKQKAAYKFIKFMCSPEITTELAIKTGYLPVRQSAIKSPAYQAYLKQYPEYSVGVNSLKIAQVQPRVPVWESIRSILDDAMFKSLGRKYDPETAIQEAVDTSDKLLYYSVGVGME